MVRYDEPLVAGIAFLLSVISALIAVGPWPQPYRLRSIDAIRQRFGMVAARLTWLVLAIALMVAGLAILTGVRPAYASPSVKARTLIKTSHIGRRVSQ